MLYFYTKKSKPAVKINGFNVYFDFEMNITNIDDWEYAIPNELKTETKFIDESTLLRKAKKYISGKSSDVYTHKENGVQYVSDGLQVYPIDSINGVLLIGSNINEDTVIQ